MATYGLLPITPGTRRLWKFLQFPATRILIATVILLLVEIGIGHTLMSVHLYSTAGVFLRLLEMALAVAGYAIFVRVIERRPISEFSLRGAMPEFGRGFVIGMALFAATMLILFLSGVASITSGAGWIALGYAFVLALQAIWEELLFRGVLFRIVEESLGSWWALAISAAVFGGLHIMNPGASVIDGVAVALEAGVLFAAVYMYTRRLWMAIALHAAWNFTEGGIFGSSVSGTTAHGLLYSTFSGPDILSGGNFGPEGSIVTLLVCLAAGVVFLWLAHRRGHIAPPLWRRQCAVSLRLANSVDA